MKRDLKKEQNILVHVEKYNLTDSGIQMLKKYRCKPLDWIPTLTHTVRSAHVLYQLSFSSQALEIHNVSEKISLYNSELW